MRRKYENRLTYAECERIFREDKRRVRDGRIKLTHNTYLVILSDADARPGEPCGEPWVYEVQLHGNGILEFRPDGSCKFDTCGWPTVTTKDRMNNYGPPGTGVSQRKHVLYLADRYGERELDDSLDTRPMSEEVAHWQAIAAAPTDQLPRLIYSDWLLDRGDNWEAYKQRKLAGVAYEELRQLIA